MLACVTCCTPVRKVQLSSAGDRSGVCRWHCCCAVPLGHQEHDTVCADLRASGSCRRFLRKGLRCACGGPTQGGVAVAGGTGRRDRAARRTAHAVALKCVSLQHLVYRFGAGAPALRRVSSIPDTQRLMTRRPTRLLFGEQRQLQRLCLHRDEQEHLTYRLTSFRGCKSVAASACP